jgi:AcrR family transcriptional regulator
MVSNSVRATPDVRREQIVAAAMQIIARDGLAAARTRAVTERCGVGVGLLNHYFRWTDLRAEAWSRMAGEGVDSLFDPSLPPSEAMERFFSSSFETAAIQYWRLWIEAFEIAAHDEKMAAVLDQVEQAMLTKLTDVLNRGLISGTWSLVDPGATALRLLALQDGLVLRLYSAPDLSGTSHSNGLTLQKAQNHLRAAFVLEIAPLRR